MSVGPCDANPATHVLVSGTRCDVVRSDRQKHLRGSCSRSDAPHPLDTAATSHQAGQGDTPRPIQESLDRRTPRKSWCPALPHRSHLHRAQFEWLPLLGRQRCSSTSTGVQDDVRINLGDRNRLLQITPFGLLPRGNKAFPATLVFRLVPPRATSRTAVQALLHCSCAARPPIQFVNGPESTLTCCELTVLPRTFRVPGLPCQMDCR